MRDSPTTRPTSGDDGRGAAARNAAQPGTEPLRQCLIRLSSGLADVRSVLSDDDRSACENMVSSFRRSLIPQLGADFPLLVAVTGGGSSGKSTVFNTLAGTRASAASPRAGYTRRMVAAIHPNVAADEAKMALLFERFRENARPRKLESADETREAGAPVYVECPSVPARLVLVDTPDFDTGTAVGFTNRAAATEILDVSDVIVYIVTNQTYNNKSASDYIRSILSEVGVRKVALLYRCPPAFTEDDVREHMEVSLSNLYPDRRTAEGACIGIWRIDESNDVAAGTADPVFRPLAGGIPLEEALAALDPTKTRADVMRTAIADALRCADGWIRESEDASRKFAAYRDSLRFLTSDACRRCLALTPQRDILRLFTEEWEGAQHWAVRNGHWLSRRIVGLFQKRKDSGRETGFAESFRKEFLESARSLQKDREPPDVRFDFPKADRDLQPLAAILEDLARKEPDGYAIRDLDPRRKTGNFAATVSRPRLPDRDDSAGPSAGEALARMVNQAQAAMGDTESIRPEIRALVRTIRADMTIWQSAREWFSASLDTVALVGTLSYIAVTGDAFTGGALLSMFGLNDLVAVPALGAFLAANGNIDRKAVEKQMSALFTTWAKGKAGVIRTILEDGITGGDIAVCDEQCKQLDATLAGLKGAVAGAREQAALVFGNAG